MTDTSITDNVTPLPIKPKRDSTAALRQRRRRAKRRLSVTAPHQSKSGLAELPSNINADVTPLALAPHVIAVRSKRTNYALVIIAYGFFLLGIGINVWNAVQGGAVVDMALPALGVLAEAVVFFLPAWALTLPIGRQALAGSYSPLYRCSP
jgi:hypothetical protein